MLPLSVVKIRDKDYNWLSKGKLPWSKQEKIDLNHYRKLILIGNRRSFNAVSDDQ